MRTYIRKCEKTTGLSEYEEIAQEFNNRVRKVKKQNEF